MITLHPIGTVRNSRPTVDDDHWGSLVSTIELNDSLGEDALEHIDDFSHAEVIFFFITSRNTRSRQAPDIPAIIKIGRRWESLPSAAGTGPIDLG